MTGLLPHERPCPDCGGNKVIECSGIGPNRVGRVSIMESPDEWTEPCQRCDQTGVIMDDRRECRVTAGTVADAFTALRNELALKHAELIESEAHVDALLTENRRLREVVHKAARQIEARSIGGVQ